MITPDAIHEGSCWTRPDHRATYLAIVSRIETNNAGVPYMIHWTDNNSGPGMTLAKNFPEIFVPVKVAKLTRIT